MFKTIKNKHKMQRFNIKIDLSDFFHDERKFVMILVDPDWENVKFLQHRVETIFGIDRVQFLTNEGCFIPQEEPIEIIKHVDGGFIKAFISSKSLEKRRKHKKSKQNAEPLAEEQIDAESLEDVKTLGMRKKKNYFSLESGLDSRSQKAAQRAHATMDCKVPIVNNKSNEISSTSEHQQINTVETEVENKFLKAAKRKRKRKNKNTVEESMENDAQEKRANNTTTSEQSPFSHAGIPSSTPFFTSNKPEHDATKETRKCKSAKTAKTFPNKIKTIINHNGYNGDIVTTTTEPQSDSNEQPDETVTSTKIVFRCSLNDVGMNQPRIFQAIKLPIDIQEQLIFTPFVEVTSHKNIANEPKVTKKAESIIEIIAKEIDATEDDHSHLNSSSVIAVDEDETGIEQVSEIIDLNETEYVIM